MKQQHCFFRRATKILRKLTFADAPWICCSQFKEKY